MKLAQVGFGDFLADTRVRRLKGKRVDTILTVPDTNKLIVNIKL